MDPQQVYPIMLFLHDLASAIWVGGMFALLLAVLPSIRKILGKGKETKQLIATIKKRLSIAVYVSFIILIITGLMLAKSSGQTGGKMLDFSFSNKYSTLLAIKHILYILILVVSIVRSRIIDNLKGMDPKSKEKWNMILLLLNIIMALAVLFISAQLAGIVKFASMPSQP